MIELAGRRSTPDPNARAHAVAVDMHAYRGDWVPETRFGRWFLGTEVWRKYVLAEAVGGLRELVGNRQAPGGHVLDIGCGQGTATALIDEVFSPARITGVDIDAALIARARGNLRSAGLRADVAYLRGSATRLPLADASVDLVLCHQLLHHLVRQQHALLELRRVLRPGGVLVAAESCRRFIESGWVRAFFRHPRETQRSADEYVALVRGAGFAVADSDVRMTAPWWSLPDLGLRRRWSRVSPRLDAGQATEVLIVAERPA